MKICMIAEGSYPYVTGGVSSWMHTIIRSFPEHGFIVYAIGAAERNRGVFRYQLPEHVEHVHECFLDVFLTAGGRRNRPVVREAAHMEAFTRLLAGRGADWNDIFDFILKNPGMNTADFVMSRFFYEIAENTAERHFPNDSFNELFWCFRSMLLPLMGILFHPIPAADVYHAVSTGYAGVIAALGARRHGGRCILTEHGIYTREREEEIIRSDWVQGRFKDLWIAHFRELSNCAYAVADPVISLFGAARELQMHFGCDGRKTRVIPNGVAPERFASLPPRGKRPGECRVGGIVRVVPIKDIKTMIQAFDQASRRHANLTLYIMGPDEEDPEYAEECRDLVRFLGNDRIHFTGQVQITEWLESMDILLLSSISEGQPLAVLEGMAAGKPHVVTDVGSCRELMEGAPHDAGDQLGPAGHTVPVLNPERMAEAICRLAEDAPVRARMGDAAKKRVNASYRLASCIEAYRGVYEGRPEIGGNRI